jgi:hypothetical protein
LSFRWRVLILAGGLAVPVAAVGSAAAQESGQGLLLEPAPAEDAPEGRPGPGPAPTGEPSTARGATDETPTAGEWVFQDALPDWDLGFTNTIRADDYRVAGNRQAAPYTDTGGQIYDEFTLSARRRVSEFERLDVRFSGVSPGSEYRTTEPGFVAERGRVLWEKGDGALPFRAEGGDFFAFQSLRTVQTSLKGGQVEVQPDLGDGRQHSVQVFTGLQSPTYNELDDDPLLLGGASWLAEDDSWGTFALNAVHGRRDADTVQGTPERTQQVASLAHAIPFELAGQDFDWETEIAGFNGDTDGGGQDESSYGLFTELAGRSQDLPLSYRTSLEQYGEDYQPFGAAVRSDQRAAQNYATWRFDGGLSLRGRYLYFRDALSTDNPTDTHTVGTTLSGPVPVARDLGLLGTMDAFVSDIENRDETVETQTQSLTLNLSAPLSERVTGRTTLLGTRNDDQTAGGVTRITRQGTLAVDYDLPLGDGWRGSVSPGVTARYVTGGGKATFDLSPVVSASLSGNGHTLRTSYNRFFQDPRGANGVDTDQETATFAYSYRTGSHRFGVDADYFERRPDGRENSEAWRLGVFYTLNLQRPPVVTAAADRAAAPAGLPTMADLAPGQPLSAVQEQLYGAGLGAPIDRPGLLIYEARLLEQIQRRQQLAIEHQGGVVQSTTLAIEFDGVGDGRTAQRTFQEVRALLLRRYGPPDIQIEEGAFGPGLSGALRTGQFLRVYQWPTQAGVLRFGIPSRPDGIVRMEIRHARDLPPPGSADWSLFELR